MPESKVLITGLKVYPPGAESARLGWIDIDGSTEVAEHVGEAVSELSKSTLFRVDENSLKQTADGSLVTFSVTVRRIAEEGDDGSK